MRTLLLAAFLASTSTLVPVVGIGAARAADAPAVANVSAVVSVPLYGALDRADGTAFVAVRSGEKTLLLRLATGHDELRVSEGAAKKLGGTISGKGDKKRATFDSWAIGAASFTDVKAKVVEGGALRGADGEIGLTAVPGIAWAVLPSKGEVHIAPSAAAESLFTAVGGTKTAFTSVPATKRKIGTGPKVELTAAPVVLAATWSGVGVPARVSIERSQSNVSAEVDGAGSWYQVKGSAFAPTPLPAAPAVPDGASRQEWREVALAGVTGWARIDRPAAGMRSAFDLNARVGMDVLGQFDLVVDGASRQIALAKASANLRSDFGAETEKLLREALVPKADADEKAKADARKAGVAPLGEHLRRRGNLTEAVALLGERTTLDASACQAWLDHGTALLQVGTPAEAAVALRKASELYAPWGALPLAERAQVEQDKAKAEKGGGAWDGATPQDSRCHRADGSLALALVAAGQPTQVATLYPAKLDLDVDLALAAGSAALSEGDAARAEAAFRQAITMAKTYEPLEARAGLAMALAKREPALATAQLERIRFASGVAGSGTDPLVVRGWFAMVEARAGRGEAQKALGAFASSAPWDAVLAVEHARALGGDAAAWDAAASAVARAPVAHPGTLALAAMVKLGRGDAAGALVAAKAAVAADETNALAWLALADADPSTATESRRRAGLVALRHPMWAGLLAK